MNLDFSLVKNFYFTESVKLQLRGGAFNVTNTPHFSNPNAILSQGNVGTITSTIGNARIMQFALRVMF